MSNLFLFISTKTTVDPALPTTAFTQADFNRRTANGFQGLAGGHQVVGEIKMFPKGDATTGFLLCNGATLNVIDFPQLGQYLGNLFGGDGVVTFALPDYTATALAGSATLPAQTVDSGGTVSTGTTTVTNPTGTGEIGGTTGGSVISGGRPRHDGLPEF